MNQLRHPSITFILIATVVVFLIPSPTVEAQWSSDPSAPLPVADRSGTQSHAKMVATSDGGVYVSWYDDSFGGNDIYLQRLDMLGYEQWAHNGVLVADRGFLETQEYGLSIDTSGNALLAFRDDRGATTEITVSKVSPDGTLLWGADGVQVSSGGAVVASPRVTGTDDGSSVVAWTSDSNVIAQKLDSSGEVQWNPAGVTLSPSAGWFGLSDLQSSNEGTAIVSFIHLTNGVFFTAHLWAQKLASADGAFTWGTNHVPVYDHPPGSLQIGYLPRFVPDGAGGAVFSWYTIDPSFQCRVQRVSTDGSLVFPEQGVEVSTEMGRIRIDPIAVFDESTKEVFVAWLEMDLFQVHSGVYAQKIDASGVRQWGDSGSVIRSISADSIHNVTILQHDEHAFVGWIRSSTFGEEQVVATRVSTDGVVGWTPSPVVVGNLLTHSSQVAATIGGPGYAAYAWTDGDGAVADILVANLLSDGSLGYAGEIFWDDFETGDTRWWSDVDP